MDGGREGEEGFCLPLGLVVISGGGKGRRVPHKEQRRSGKREGLTRQHALSCDCAPGCRLIKVHA